MKKIMFRGLILLTISLFSSVYAEAQFVVKIRPVAPVVRVKPVMPSQRHVWVNGDYVWRGGRYVYINGYWTEPPFRKHRWVGGHWKHTRRGWTWIPGHWR